MSAQRPMTTFNGQGDLNVFLLHIDWHIKRNKLSGEEGALVLASRLEEPAFNVYMRMPTNEKKDLKKVKNELRRIYRMKKKDGNRTFQDIIFLRNISLRRKTTTT